MKFEVTGGAGQEEAAAIAAVIGAIAEEEANAAATPTQVPRQSSWVLAWRPRDTPAPLPSHTYEAQQWTDVEPGGGSEPS